MIPSEFKKNLSQLKSIETYNLIEEVYSFPAIKESVSLNGLYEIYKYVYDQVQGWTNYGELPTELKTSCDFFITIQSELIGLLKAELVNPNRNPNQLYNTRIRNYNKGSKDLLPFECPQVIFLVNLFHEYKSEHIFRGAYSFVIADNTNVRHRDEHFGKNLAYEYTFSNSEIIRRSKIEKQNLRALVKQFSEKIDEADSILTRHTESLTEKHDDYIKSIDILKAEKSNAYDEWFVKNKENHEAFKKKCHEDLSSTENTYLTKIKELEETYREKLKLEEPANYWQEKGKELKNQGTKAMCILIALVVAVCASLAYILINTPEQIYASWFNGDVSVAIRWTIVYATFISFAAYLIRSINKYMFSSFHLARDCEERHKLTYFYLALLKDSQIHDNERQLIMQSLFSRADTGLLKEDSSPTMPNEMVNKFINPIK